MKSFFYLLLFCSLFTQAQNNGVLFHPKHELHLQENEENLHKLNFLNKKFVQWKIEKQLPDLLVRKNEIKSKYKNTKVNFEEAFNLLFEKESNELKKAIINKGDLSNEALKTYYYELYSSISTQINNEPIVNSYYKKHSDILTTYKLGSGYYPTPQAACTNVDFADGTTNGWQCSWGTGSGNQINAVVGYQEENDCDGLTESYDPVTRLCCWPTIWPFQTAGCRTPAFSTVAITANINNPAVTLTANSGPVNSSANAGGSGVHTIMTGGTDPNAPISVTPPGGGNSIRLGNASVNLYKAQRLRQTFTVGAGNPNFVYQYAVVLQDPGSGHTISDQPYFKIRMYDQSNNEIDCATYDVDAVSAPSIGGFQSVGDVLYKNWSTVTVPLLSYVGQNVTIEFTTSDCALGGHYGYAYIQCLCSPIPIVSSLPVICNGQTTTLTAPPGAATYSWTGPGIVSGGATQSAVVNVGGTYTVNMTTFYSPPQVPCVYSQSISLPGAPAAANSNFSFTPVCLGAPNTFTNNSSGAGIFQYIWDFGDGSPTFTTATLTNPVHTYTTAGNYSVSLIADNGCPQPFSLPLTIKPQPTATFVTTNVCENVSSVFTNSSLAPAPESITSSMWYFGDGTVVNNTGSPVHTYTVPNTYSVKLVVTNSQFCKDSITKTLTVYPKPFVSAGSNTVCLNLTTLFTNSTTVAAPDNIATWAWDFDNNGTVDNGAQFPTNTFTTVGTHTVELKAITNNGCRDSTTIPVLVNAIQTAVFTASNACINAPISIVNTTTVTPPDVITSYNWDFGVGANPTTGTGYNPTLPSYSSSGTKTITLNLTASSSCTANLVQTIQVYAQPVANFSTTSVCQSSATAFTDLSTSGGTITGWQWDYENDGNVESTSNSPTYVYPASGTFTASLIVTDNNTCSDTVALPLDVWGHTIPDFSPEAVCFGTATTFTNLTNITTNANTGGTPSYVWDFADGSGTSSTVSPAHTYSTGISGATYNVTLTATSTHGCVDDIVKPVYINALPTATFSALNACLNSPVILNNTSTIGVPDVITNYMWNFGMTAVPSTTSNAQNPTALTYSTSGAKTITLTVTANTTCSASITQTIGIYPQPIASFSTTSVCQSTATAFTDLSTSAFGTITNWEWDFTNDGFVDNTTNAPTNIYASSGTYSTSLIATDNFTCKDTVVALVTVFGHAVPDFTATSVCFNAATTFSNLTSVTTNSNTGAISQYSWDFGDLSPLINTANPSHTYTNGINGATYNVTLTATTSNTCIDNVVKTVTIHPLPAPSYTLANACMNANVGINNTSTVAAPDNISNYDWNFGSGASPTTTSTAQNPLSLSYGTSGVKTVTLMLTSNNSCTATATQTVMIYPQPIANFSATSVCQSTATAFTDLSTSSGSITAWQWDYTNNGSVDNTTNAPNFTFPVSGTFTTSLIVMDSNTCKDTIALAVDVWGHTIPDFTPDAVCFGTATTFSNLTNTTTNANVGGTPTYVWDFADGSSVNGLTNPTHTYTLGGNTNATYNVTLTATSSHNCIDNIVKTVSVYAVPSASFTSDSVCLGQTTQLIDASNGNGNAFTNYEWDFLNNGTVDASGISSPNFIFPTHGINAVSYTVTTSPISGLTCKNSTNTITVWVNPNPIADFTFVNNCINVQPNIFDASSSSIAVGSNTAYVWAFGDSGGNSGISVTHVYATAQTYMATLTVTSNKGCQNSISKQVEVYQKPTTSVAHSNACDGKSMTFTATALPGSPTVANFAWDLNNNVNTIEANGQTVSNIFAAAGNQTVNLISTSTIGSCKDTLKVGVYVDYLPVPSFTVDNPAGCPLPHCVRFTDLTPSVPAPAQIVNWKWVLGDGTVINSATNAAQSNCYTNTSSNQLAQFDVKLVVTTDKGCVDSLTENNFITVYPKPIAQYSVEPNPTDILAPTVYFTNQSQDYTKWWWNFGDSDHLDSVNMHPVHEYNGVNAGDYYSYLIVANQYKCVDKTAIKVEIKPEFTFYIPNAFTPNNGDGINDIFTGMGIGIEKYEMWVFDRWGARIFYTDDIHHGWNGKYQGKDEICKQDVYVWKVKLKDVLGKNHDYTGHVTLIQ